MTTANASTVTVSTVRTAAAARAERLARQARPARVTDESADALLGSYDPRAEYPALSSRNLARREQRDLERRDIHTGEQQDSRQNQDGAAYSGFVGGTGDACFNRVTRAPNPAAAAIDECVSADIARLLDALELTADAREMVWLRMEGHSLAEIGDRFRTSKQTIDRRLQAVGMKLFAHWLTDESCGYESVIRAESNRAVVRSLSGGRPAVAASACACGSHQHRVQRVVGQPGVFTYHCCNCKTKRTEKDFRSLISPTA